MKRFIKSNNDRQPSKIGQILKDHGIDTTSHKYELVAEEYGRYDSGPIYTKRFSCHGDYLAYLSMVIHEAPTVARILKYFDEEEFAELVDANPTVEAIADYASSCWYGDGDDYIIKLQNLDTGKVLYEGDYDFEDAEEDYDEDEDW